MTSFTARSIIVLDNSRVFSWTLLTSASASSVVSLANSNLMHLQYRVEDGFSFYDTISYVYRSSVLKLSFFRVLGRLHVEFSRNRFGGSLIQPSPHLCLRVSPSCELPSHFLTKKYYPGGHSVGTALGIYGFIRFRCFEDGRNYLTAFCLHTAFSFSDDAFLRGSSQ